MLSERPLCSHFLFESIEGCAGCGDLVRQGAPKVDKFVSRCEFLATHCDISLCIRGFWCRLVHDVSLPCRDGETKVCAGLGEYVHTFLHVCLMVAFSTQSSANRESSTVSLFTFVLACSLQGLKSLPSVRYPKSTPTSPLRNASVSMAENIILKRVGASTQPCFTPFVTKNGLENSPSFWTLACMPSWNWRTIVMNLAGQPKVAIILHRPSRQTVSKAFEKSTKVV